MRRLAIEQQKTLKSADFVDYLDNIHYEGLSCFAL
jgi:hypothetical protein